MAGPDVAVPPAAGAVLDRLGRTARPDAARDLSERYRRGASSARRPVLRDDVDLAVYAVTRFPATFAAARAVFAAVAAVDPPFAPVSLLDVGTGLGATTLAALATWPSLVEVTCVEPDPRAIRAGRDVVGTAVAARWAAAVPDDGRADLVTAGYVANELSDPVGFADRLWRATVGTLVLVEPGRAAATEALLAARSALLADGAHMTAPCPHQDRCPWQRTPDWCHFGQRLARSSAHRAVKGADRGFEDEKYAYVAVSRRPTEPVPGRVVARPRYRKGLVELTVCAADGTVRAARVGRSDPAYRAARDVGWGDAWPVDPTPSDGPTEPVRPDRR